MSEKTPCNQVNRGTACDIPRGGDERVCPDCNPRAAMPAGWSECCTCHYRWRTGQHGGHNCAQQLLEELAVTDKLLAKRNALLQTIPGCEEHGDQCVPHAMEWVAESIQARAAITSLQAELAQARADAGRYRWLRRGKPRTTGLPREKRIEVMQWLDRCEANVLKGDALDAAIDAAMLPSATDGGAG